jgi:CPA1 family monovalent cation:H+ antiporter
MPVTHGPDVELFLGLVVVVAVVAAAVQFVRLPYTVALVVTGLALAFLPDMPRVELTPSIILTVFLPVLLFYGAYNFNAADLRAVVTSVSLLAIPGVVATAGLVGLALYVTTSLSLPEALLFGTIVSATDPVAVLAIFGELGVPRRLAAIVTGESLFNDGTALVFFATMVTVVTSHTVDVGLTIEHFLIALLGSLALGVAVGVLGSAVLRHIDEALLETTLTLIMAYGGYLAADRLGISGPLETVAAGLVLGVRGLDVMSPTTRLQAGATWEFLDFLANSLLFLLMGLALRPIGLLTASRLGIGVWLPMLLAIVAVTIARVAVVGVVQLIVRTIPRPWPRGWSAVITWSGLRGAVSLAAALSLPATLPQRPLLLTLTFGIVLFTLLAQGLTMEPLLERLGLGSEEVTRHDVELLIGRLRMVEAATHEVEMLARSNAIDEHLASRLMQEYREQQQSFREQLDATFHGNLGLQEEQEQETRRRLIRIQHQAARAAYSRGLISGSVFRDLVADLDREVAQSEADEAVGS